MLIVSLALRKALSEFDQTLTRVDESRVAPQHDMAPMCIEDLSQFTAPLICGSVLIQIYVSRRNVLSITVRFNTYFELGHTVIVNSDRSGYGSAYKSLARPCPKNDSHGPWILLNTGMRTAQHPWKTFDARFCA